jgi:hypothetical protein
MGGGRRGGANALSETNYPSCGSKSGGEMRKLPARLYKYHALTHYTMDGLRQQKLWFGPPAGFNDPFDCAQPVVRARLGDDELQVVFDRCVSSPKAPRRELEAQYIKAGRFTDEFHTMARSRLQVVLKERAEVQRHQRGVTCFAESNTDLLMWAHYADGHRGVCLEFDTRSEFFAKTTQVAYSDDYPEIGAAEIFDNDPTALLRIMIGTKSECWKYEREWRVAHMEANKLYGYGYGVLTGIYLGAMMRETDVPTIRRMFWNTQTKVHRMIRSDSSFSVSAVPEKTTEY